MLSLSHIFKTFYKVYSQTEGDLFLFSGCLHYLIFCAKVQRIKNIANEQR